MKIKVDFDKWNEDVEKTKLMLSGSNYTKMEVHDYYLIVSSEGGRDQWSICSVNEKTLAIKDINMELIDRILRELEEYEF